MKRLLSGTAFLLQAFPNFCLFYIETPNRAGLINSMRNLILSLVLFVLCAECAAQDISKIDRNFEPRKIGNVEFRFYDAKNAPFKVEGLPWRREGGEYSRLPDGVTAENASRGVVGLCGHASGAAIRFATDSKSVAVRYVTNGSGIMGHMARSGSSGFDLYLRDENGRYAFVKNFHQRNAAEMGKIPYEELGANFSESKMREFALFLPRYCGVKNVEIGVLPGSEIKPPAPHKVAKPIVFYGSSITQGGCASRPATVYTGKLCRELDAEEINLGFSGNAKGEDILAERIGDIDMSIFVYDYDYNAPSTDHLEKTHERFFKIFRKKRPDTPVIMMTRCSWPSADRVAAIRRTYENAVKAGDKNVYFIDCSKIFEPYGGIAECTVDFCHPTDLGFHAMYEAVLPVAKKILEEK